MNLSLWVPCAVNSDGTLKKTYVKGESLDFTKIKCSDTFDLIFSFCVVYLRKYVFVMLKNFTYPQT